MVKRAVCVAVDQGGGRIINERIDDGLGGDVHDAKVGCAGVSLAFLSCIARDFEALLGGFHQQLLLKIGVSEHRSDAHVRFIPGA